MNTLRAYIVDDEPLAVERLRRLLEKTKRVEIAGSATDPEMAVEYLRTHDVDVVFLDIQMPVLTGFEVIEKLDREVRVIFTTAYDRYAIDAFTVNSVDYLLKPIEPERLAKALDKLERVAGSPATDVRALARELALRLSESGQAAAARRLDRIASRVGERTTLLDVARITHFFSKDKLTFAAAAGREHVVDFTLAELEERLDRRRFVRIHRATIVNVAFVQEIYPGVDGVVVRLKDESKTELSVARDRVRELKERLGI
jgi:two-component system LytT family response regulator